MPERQAELLAQVSQFGFDDVDEAVAARFSQLLEGPGDPFEQRRVDPGHVTASGFVLSPDRSALLLILHRRLDLWLQPGGHVDPQDATVLAAARREIAEETAVVDLDLEHDGIYDLDIHRIPARPGMPSHDHYDVTYLFAARSWSMAPSPEVRDARWVPLAEARELSEDPPLLRALRRLGVQ